MALSTRRYALVLAFSLAACSTKRPAPSTAPSTAPSLGDATATASATASQGDAGGCTRVWADEDATLRSRSMYEEIAFDRAQRTITEKVHTWPAPRTARLSDAEFSALDAALSALCLSAATNEPPPPPGGPMDVTIDSKRSGARRLGVRGTTGGAFFVLTRDAWVTVFDELKKMSPEHRDCLPLRRSGTVITGKLLETKGPNAKVLVLLDSVVCAGDPPGVMAGSIELLNRREQSVAPSLINKRVSAMGQLSTAKVGDKTEVQMFVTEVKEL